MVGRADELSGDEAESLRSALADVAPGVPVVVVSPKTGEGVDQVLGYIESPMIAGRRLLDIDYDIYADGEAELGWVNLTANVIPKAEIELDSFVQTLVGDIAGAIREISGAAIAHLKASVIADGTQAIANVVSNESPVDVGLASGRSVASAIQVVVNARVAVDPSQLEQICEAAVRRLGASHGAEVTGVNAHSLRPGRPTPTHRVTA